MVESRALRVEKTQIIIKPNLDIQTCNGLGGMYKNNLCVFICISEEDQRKLPEQIDYSRVADIAINLQKSIAINLQKSIVIEREETLHLLKQNSKK